MSETSDLNSVGLSFSIQQEPKIILLAKPDRSIRIQTEGASIEITEAGEFIVNDVKLEGADQAFELYTAMVEMFVGRRETEQDRMIRQSLIARGYPNDAFDVQNGVVTHKIILDDGTVILDDGTTP